VDSAELAGPTRVDATKPLDKTIDTLVELYHMNAKFQVLTDTSGLPAGSYVLNGKPYYAESAAQGMLPQDFEVSGMTGKLARKTGGPIHVENLAANLFVSKTAGMRQDSRGFAMHTDAVVNHAKYLA